MTRFVWRVVQLSRLAFSLLFAVVCLRFTAVAASESFRETVPELNDVLPNESSAEPDTGVAQPRNPRLEPTPSAEQLRMSVIVNMRGSRSEVFINGRRKGNTPFLGSVRCHTGESVKIEVVPALGELIVRHAKCRQGTVRVDR